MFDTNMNPVIKAGNLDSSIEKFAIAFGYRYRALLNANAKYPDEFGEDEMQNIIIDDLAENLEFNLNKKITGELKYDHTTKTFTKLSDDEVVKIK